MEKKTILLVEDDGMVRNAIRGVLEYEYDILEASTYLEAVDHLKNHIDLALVDYVLPGRHNGLDIIKALREVNPGLPVILMTAYSTEDLAIKAIKAGVTDYIKKPPNFKYLKWSLLRIFEGSRNGEDYPEGVESRDVFVIDCIVAFIENNCTEELTLDKLANMAGMNKFKFCRVFKERFGVGYTSYLNKLRIKKAAELLGGSILGITEIACFVGYGSVDHFIRVFKATYGVSPREYRKIKKQETISPLP